jgi:hypothetical protein
MDITLTMLNFSADKLNTYVTEIKKSNLPKLILWELVDLIETVKEQVKQARAMGWLPPENG